MTDIILGNKLFEILGEETIKFGESVVFKIMLCNDKLRRVFKASFRWVFFEGENIKLHGAVKPNHILNGITWMRPPNDPNLIQIDKTHPDWNPDGPEEQFVAPEFTKFEVSNDMLKGFIDALTQE